MMTTTVHNTKEKYSFGITKSVSLIELLFVYVAIPTLLAWIYTLPPELKYRFILFFDHPGFLQLLTTNYVHQLFSHLQTNLFYYFLIMSIILVLETNRNRFRAMLLIVFGLIPLVTSVVTLQYFTAANYFQVIGFSAAVAGLFGYLIYLMVEKLYRVRQPGNYIAYLVWILVSAAIIMMSAAALGVTAVYSVGHLANGLGHLVGYVIGLIMCYLFRH